MKPNWTVDVVRDKTGAPPSVHKFKNPLVQPPNMVGKLGLVSEEVGGIFAYIHNPSVADQIVNALNSVSGTTQEQLEEGESPYSLIDIEGPGDPTDHQADFAKTWNENGYDVLRANGEVIGFAARDNEASNFLLTSLNNPANGDIEPIIHCECDNTHRNAHTVCRYCHYFLRLALIKIRNGQSLEFGGYGFANVFVSKGDNKAEQLFVTSNRKFYPLTLDGLADALWDTTVDADSLTLALNESVSLSELIEQRNDLKETAVDEIIRIVSTKGAGERGSFELELDFSIDNIVSHSKDGMPAIVTIKKLAVYDGDLTIFADAGGAQLETHHDDDYGTDEIIEILTALKHS